MKSRVELLKEFAEKSKAEKIEKRKRPTYFKPMEGENHIRLIPTQTAHGLPLKRFHQNILNDNHYEADGKERPSHKKWRFRSKVAVNVIVREFNDEKPRIWTTNWKAMKDIIDSTDDWGDFFDTSSEGRDLILIRKGKGLSTRYELKPAPQSSALTNGDEDEILDAAVDLDDWLKKKRTSNT